MSDRFVTYCKSQIGQIKLTASSKAITSILFVFENTGMEPENSNSVLNRCREQLNEYFAGKRKKFDINIEQEGTEFQNKVWSELIKIPFGKTVAYNNIAKKLGNTKSIRAVGAANGKNQISIIVPCHRVIGSDGSLTGYAGGLWRKEWLLKHEGKYSDSERQLDLF